MGVPLLASCLSGEGQPQPGAHEAVPAEEDRDGRAAAAAVSSASHGSRTRSGSSRSLA